MLANYSCKRMKLYKVASGAVITAVAFAVSVYVLHPVSIAVPDKNIATGDEEFPTITTQTKDNQCKQSLYVLLILYINWTVSSDCSYSN